MFSTIHLRFSTEFPVPIIPLTFRLASALPLVSTYIFINSSSKAVLDSYKSPFTTSEHPCPTPLQSDPTRSLVLIGHANALVTLTVTVSKMVISNTLTHTARLTFFPDSCYGVQSSKRLTYFLGHFSVYYAVHLRRWRHYLTGTAPAMYKPPRAHLSVHVLGFVTFIAV